MVDKQNYCGVIVSAIKYNPNYVIFKIVEEGCDLKIQMGDGKLYPNPLIPKVEFKKYDLVLVSYFNNTTTILVDFAWTLVFALFLLHGFSIFLSHSFVEFISSRSLSCVTKLVQ